MEITLETLVALMEEVLVELAYDIGWAAYGSEVFRSAS